MQGALKRVVNQSTLTKSVSIHTLRHSYASHLIEAIYQRRSRWQSKLSP